jgi:hypothetical protein
MADHAMVNTPAVPSALTLLHYQEDMFMFYGALALNQSLAPQLKVTFVGAIAFGLTLYLRTTSTYVLGLAFAIGLHLFAGPTTGALLSVVFLSLLDLMGQVVLVSPFHLGLVFALGTFVIFGIIFVPTNVAAPASLFQLVYTLGSVSQSVPQASGVTQVIFGTGDTLVSLFALPFDDPAELFTIFTLTCQSSLLHSSIRM